MLKHILSDINYLLGNSCSFGGDRRQGRSATLPITYKYEKDKKYEITWNGYSGRYTVCIKKLEKSNENLPIYEVIIMNGSDSIGRTFSIEETDMVDVTLIGFCAPLGSVIATGPAMPVKRNRSPSLAKTDLDILAKVVDSSENSKPKRRRGRSPPQDNPGLRALTTVAGASAIIAGDTENATMDGPPVTKWVFDRLSFRRTHSLQSYNNIYIGNVLQIFILEEKKKSKLFNPFTGIIIGIYQSDTEINILILFDDGKLFFIDFNLIIFRNNLIHTHNQELLTEYAKKAKDKNVESSEVTKFNSIRGPYINPRNIISYNIDPDFIKNITDRYISNGDIVDEEVIIDNFIDFESLKLSINRFDENEYRQFISSRRNILISLPPEQFVDDFKLAILLDQWKDFIKNDKVKYNPGNKDIQKTILFDKIKEHIIDDGITKKNIDPKDYTENIMKKLGVASYTLINIYNQLNINPRTWTDISEKFLKALIILTKKKKLNLLNVFDNTSTVSNILIVLNKILKENENAELCIAVDALSGLANFGPLLNAMGNRYRIFMGPVNFADGAMSEDTLAKTSLPYGLVDDFSFLVPEIQIKMDNLLNFTFTNNVDDFLKYTLFIKKFGIVAECGKREPDPASGKYTISNSVKRFQDYLEDLKLTPNNVKLITKDLCEKSSKTIMDMSKSIVFKEYITQKKKPDNYIFYGNDNSSTLFAKYFLKELSSVVYLGGSAELAKSGLGKFKIVFTIDEARQLFGLGPLETFPEISSMFDETIIPFTTPDVTVDMTATVSATLSGGSGAVSGNDEGMEVDSRNKLTIEGLLEVHELAIQSFTPHLIEKYFKSINPGYANDMYNIWMDSNRTNIYTSIVNFIDWYNQTNPYKRQSFGKIKKNKKDKKNKDLSKLNKEINYLLS